MFLNDISADGTIARIISTIEAKQFQECFINWISSVHTLTEGQVVAIDGSIAVKIELAQRLCIIQ
jgi:hypothetical protein